LANQEARTSFLRAQAKSRIEKEGIVIPEELKQKGSGLCYLRLTEYLSTKSQVTKSQPIMKIEI
jgi:hypothetical protein